MIKIMFVCHGNICRSPMAEFMLKDLVKKDGKESEFLIESSATSFEEQGNPIHRGTRAVLDRLGIKYNNRRAVRLCKDDYLKFDYFIGMDDANKYNMLRIFGGDPDGKISLLLDYTGEYRDVADPYWTGNFNETENDILNGVKEFYEYIKAKKSK